LPDAQKKGVRADAGLWLKSCGGAAQGERLDGPRPQTSVSGIGSWCWIFADGIHA
jgi:hypothetical protein